MWEAPSNRTSGRGNILNYQRLDQSENNISKNWITGNYQDVVFISLGDRPELQDVVEPAKICLKACRNSSTISRSRT